MYEEEGQGHLNTAGINLHELYLSYVRAGFTEEQSFELVKITLQGAVNG